MANGYIPAELERAGKCGPVKAENRAFLGGVLGIDVNGERQPISEGGIVDLTFVMEETEEAAAQASAAAAAAQASERDAESASSAAQDAQRGAERAATASQTAQGLAEDAQENARRYANQAATSATAAASSAATAGSSATAASNSATQANNSKILAETAQERAEAAQASAEAAAHDVEDEGSRQIGLIEAAGEAERATLSGYVDQAATSAENAATSATAAAGSATAASGSATAAAQSATQAAAFVGSPLKASLASEMTDTNKVYVYTGAEVGLTAGHWYYYDGSGWADGGVYNAVATDDTLSVQGAAAGSKAVGDILKTGGRVAGIAQGARNASGNIATNAKRCTTSDTFQLVAGDVIQITNLDSGIKAAIAGVSGGSFIHDSGWITQSDIYFVVETAGTYFVNFAKVVDGNLSPSGIVTATVTVKNLGYFNQVEAIPTIKKDIDSIAENSGYEKDVTNLFLFKDGGFVRPDGSVSTTSSVQSSSSYVAIPPGFDDVIISVIIRPDNVQEGLAFYADKEITDFISGVQFPVDYTQTGLTWTTAKIPIPRTAKFLRTSWVATTYETYSSFTFACKLVRNGKIARVSGSTSALESLGIDGFINVTKADMENGTLDSNSGFVPQANRCRLANRYIKARKGDIVVGHKKTANILMAVVDDEVASNILYTTGWRAYDFALKTPCDGYYALLGYANPDDFDGEFTIYPAKQHYKGLPDNYYQDEVDATLTAITEAQSEPCLCFPLVTDIHYGATGTTEQPFLFHKTFRNMLKIAQEKKCDAVVNLGDIMDGSFSAKQTAMDYAMRVNDMLMSLSVPYLITLGNHDDNHYYTGSNQRLSVSDLYKANLAYTGGKPYYNASTGGRDYYVDFDNLKIRLVCLNSYNYTNSSYAYAAETVSWFTNIALDTPDDYLVVVLTHISPISSQNYNGQSVTNGSSISQAIENYISGGKPAIQFYGHSHCDVAFTSPYLSISTCCNKFEDENGDPTKWPTGATMPERTEKTASEDLWDFVVIKPASRTVDLIRFGAGSDRTFTY